MLRGLLMRRSSSYIPSGGAVGDKSDDIKDSADGLAASRSSPLYGDVSNDIGDEIRFSVELTRIDRLEDTLSLDIRRLKGNLRSYKFIYDTLREFVYISRCCSADSLLGGAILQPRYHSLLPRPFHLLVYRDITIYI